VSEADVPWLPVVDGEAASLMRVYREAREVAARLRAALELAGLGREEFPELCATVDVDGRPGVLVGSVRPEVARRLGGLLLSGAPRPPSPGGHKPPGPRGVASG
jgi:hypothetical protein